MRGTVADDSAGDGTQSGNATGVNCWQFPPPARVTGDDDDLGGRLLDGCWLERYSTAKGASDGRRTLFGLVACSRCAVLVPAVSARYKNVGSELEGILVQQVDRKRY